MVPADSLFANDGTRGGRVGIAPVDPDRLPGPLPQGLEFPIVITVQTDGATNFDVPVAVRFPNLPDPITGETLAPGDKSALWSFNHDSGNFELVGPMTVDDTGMFVESDPGFGIRAPGWHGIGIQAGTSCESPRVLEPFFDTSGPCADGLAPDVLFAEGSACFSNAFNGFAASVKQAALLPQTLLTSAGLPPRPGPFPNAFVDAVKLRIATGEVSLAAGRASVNTSACADFYADCIAAARSDGTVDPEFEELGATI